MSWIAPAVGIAVKVFGGLFGGGGGDKVDVDALRRQIAAECKTASDEQKQQLQGLIAELEEQLKRSLAEQAAIQAILEKPVKEREARVKLVNDAKITIKQTERIAFVGEKGTGKSSVMWLLGASSVAPIKSLGDGSVTITHGDNFTDTIGLKGWTAQELLKLLVVLIYNGLPADLIVFAPNDRIVSATAELATIGINNPMIVVFQSICYLLLERGMITLNQPDDKGVRRLTNERDLDLMYDRKCYEMMLRQGLGQGLTHHDDISARVASRVNQRICPFERLFTMLRDEGDVFIAPATNEMNGKDNIIKELIFRFIYIYETKYKQFGNQAMIKFINHATLTEF